MDDLLYNSCVRYFTTLGNYGFKNDEEVKKLLFYVFIQELVNTTSIVISEEDYKHLEGALYCIYGTTCLIPYPKYCENPMYAHLGDIAELSVRVSKTEDELAALEKQNLNGRLTEVENKVEVLDDLDLVLEGEEVNS